MKTLLMVSINAKIVILLVLLRPACSETVTRSIDPRALKF
jgi:hypothetical protein